MFDMTAFENQETVLRQSDTCSCRDGDVHGDFAYFEHLRVIKAAHIKIRHAVDMLTKEE